MITIYAIVCRANRNKHYVGCTSGKVAKRWREHKCLLKAGKHASRTLQTDWMEFGEAKFCVTVLETFVYDTTVKTKREAELKWMAFFDADGRLYNERQISFQPPEGAQRLAVKARIANGYKPSAESNLKRRLAQLGKPKGHGAKISATKRAKQLMR